MDLRHHRHPSCRSPAKGRLPETCLDNGLWAQSSSLQCAVSITLGWTLIRAGSCLRPTEAVALGSSRLIWAPPPTHWPLLLLPTSMGWKRGRKRGGEWQVEHPRQASATLSLHTSSSSNLGRRRRKNWNEGGSASHSASGAGKSWPNPEDEGEDDMASAGDRLGGGRMWQSASQLPTPAKLSSFLFPLPQFLTSFSQTRPPSMRKGSSAGSGPRSPAHS